MPFIGSPGPAVLPPSANPSRVIGLTAPDDSSMPDDPGSVEPSTPDGLGVSYASAPRSSGARAHPCIAATGSWGGPSLGRSLLSCLDSAQSSGAAPRSPAPDSVENHPASDRAWSGGRDVAALDFACSVCGSVGGAGRSAPPPAVEDPPLPASSGSVEPFSRGCASTPCAWAVAPSSYVVMPLCLRKASGRSDPQIGSSRDSAGSCVGSVSPYGSSRDRSGGPSSSCAGPATAWCPLVSPAGDPSVIRAVSVVAGGDDGLTDVPCSRSPSPA
jgi:hypothetical protein